MVDDPFSKICFELGSTACKDGDVTLTYILYQRAFSGNNPVSQASLATTLKKLGKLYFERESYADAANLYEKAVAIYKDMPVPDDEGLRDTLDELADVYYKTGKYDQATRTYEGAMEIEGHLKVKDKEKMQYRMEQIIWLQLHQGNYEDAQSAYRMMTRVQSAPDRTH